MPSKTYDLDAIGAVTITKRRSNRHLRITLAPEGDIRVTIPTWVPYQAGVDFVMSKSLWISAQKPATKKLSDGQAIGRAHRLAFRPLYDGSAKTRTRLVSNQVIVSYPYQLSPNSSSVQTIARAAATRALRRQAESLLPNRLATLATANELSYANLTVKALKRRWGSCDQKRQIVLNLFLMQLPWELIDYVILHELTHTKHLNHSPEFWAMLESMLPEARKLRKQLHNYPPGVLGYNGVIDSVSLK